MDVESRAVIVRRHGDRSSETSNAAFCELKERLAPGHVPVLVTTDEFGAYPEAVLVTFGKERAVKRKPGPGRPPLPVIEPARQLVYAQVDKKRSSTGRLEKVDWRVVFGTPQALAQRLETSESSRSVNTAFLERFNGVDRHFNSRKARKTCEFSKAVSEHRATSWLVLGLGIFCWAPRRVKGNGPENSGNRSERTPAMVLGRAKGVLSVGEFIRLRPIALTLPTLQDIRLKRTEFHKPEKRPTSLDLWPKKKTVQKSLKQLGISARGIG
jgi:IS1 family transposase